MYPWTDCKHGNHEHFVLKNTTFRAPAIIPNFTEYCACHKKWHLNFTKYSACHEKWMSWLILFTHETSFTMRGATRVSLQLQQILRLPRKMNLMIDPCHKWNVIYNARSNMCHCPNSPNAAPATQNDSHDWSLSHMKRYLQCAEQHVSLSKLTKCCACHAKWFPWLILVTHETLFTMRRATCVIVQTHQILRLPRKMTVENFKENCWKRMKRHLQCAADPRMIRPWNRQSATRLATEVTLHVHHEHFVLKNTTFALRLSFQISPNEKWMSWLILFTHETSFTMRGATSVIVQTHQILRLPRKMIPMTDPCHIWNVIYNAQSNRCHRPTSPNTAPATKNDRPKCERNLVKTDETSFTMRGRSETVPRMIRPWNRQSATRLASEPPAPPTPANNTGRCPIDPQCVRQPNKPPSSWKVGLLLQPRRRLEAWQQAVLDHTDKFIVERKSSLQSCMDKKQMHTSNELTLVCHICNLKQNLWHTSVSQARSPYASWLGHKSSQPCAVPNSNTTANVSNGWKLYIYNYIYI